MVTFWVDFQVFSLEVFTLTFDTLHPPDSQLVHCCCEVLFWNGSQCTSNPSLQLLNVGKSVSSEVEL